MNNSPTIDKATAYVNGPSLIENTIIETQLKNESLLEQLTSKKLYIYVIIAICVLAYISYYLYNKYFSNKEQIIETISNNKQLESKKHILSPDTEYYLLDNDGNPILMNEHLNIFLQNQSEQTKQLEQPKQPEQTILINNKLSQYSEPSKQQQQTQQQQTQQQQMQKQQMQKQQMQQQQMQKQQQMQMQQQQMQQQQMQQQQLQQQQMQQQQMQQQQKQRPRLSHPNVETNNNVNITDNEDDNIATQDLTQDEIEGLKKQLDLMQMKQSASITAQNDEDGNEANF